MRFKNKRFKTLGERKTRDNDDTVRAAGLCFNVSLDNNVRFNRQV